MNNRRGASSRFANKPAGTRQVDRVAQMLSEEYDVGQIAERLGARRAVVNARITDIRKELGWQAV